MAKRYLIMIGLLSHISLYAESFISEDEYAQMLYKSPRGIGCDKCHGTYGEGLVLSSYVDKKGVRIEIKAPRIDNISSRRFYQSFERKSRLMPQYFLTDREKAYLFYYLSKNQKKERIANVD